MKKITLLLAIALLSVSLMASTLSPYRAEKDLRLTEITDLACQNGYVIGTIKVKNMLDTQNPNVRVLIPVGVFDHYNNQVGSTNITVFQLPANQEAGYYFTAEAKQIYSYLPTCWFYVSAGNPKVGYISKTVGVSAYNYPYYPYPYPQHPTFGPPWYNNQYPGNCWINKKGNLVCDPWYPVYSNDCWKVEKHGYKCGWALPKKNNCWKIGKYMYQCPKF